MLWRVALLVCAIHISATCRQVPAVLPHSTSHNVYTTSPNSLHLAGILPTLLGVPNDHSIPITQRVPRNRQRLPSSLLIENASCWHADARKISCPRHFRSSLATTREVEAVRRGSAAPSSASTPLCDCRQLGFEEEAECAKDFAGGFLAEDCFSAVRISSHSR